MKYTDIHCHVFPDKLAEKASKATGDFYNTSMWKPASVDNLLQAHQKAGITRCVISNSAVTPQQVGHLNDFLARAAAEHPEFVAFGSLFPGMDGWQEELDRMQELGLRGLKIHPDFQKMNIDDPAGVEMYREVARRGLPVLFHMGDSRYDFSSPQRLLNLLRQVPDLKVIAAHFGGWTAWEESYRHPMPEGVLYDTSSTTPLVERDFVLRMLDRMGAERFLFGSDFPMWEPKEMVSQIEALGLDRHTLEMIFHGNFEKLLGE